jgi:hypothetical protein
MRINKLILILLFVLFCSCNKNSQNKTEIGEAEKDTIFLVENQPKEAKEDFQSFFIQFQQDSVFQLTRIEFPLTDSIYESGAYMDDFGNVVDLSNREIIINSGEWEYDDFKMFYRKIISKISENKYNVELHIEDTGVRINYIFELDNEKWFLVEIKDESM